MNGEAAAIANELGLRVGGFFRNTRVQEFVTCRTCRGPSTAPWCAQCVEQRSNFNGLLADRVYPLTYVRGYAERGIHQSAYTVRAYKQSPSAPKCLDDMKLMVFPRPIFTARALPRPPARRGVR